VWPLNGSHLAYDGAFRCSVNALRLLECLVNGGLCEVFFMISQARSGGRHETSLTLPPKAPGVGSLPDGALTLARALGQIRVFGKQDWMAPVASGSPARPAPMRSVMSLLDRSFGRPFATGASSTNLIERGPRTLLLKERPQTDPWSHGGGALFTLHLENI